MYITNDSAVAQIAEAAGVDRIFIDLETLGKEERQKGMDTVKSHHSEEDVARLSKVVKNSEILVRVNPINPDSIREINSVIEKGADVIMLPMFKTSEEVQTFVDIVNHRAKTVLLLEHIDAVNRLDEILEVEGIEEIHIGLNDLHLSMNKTFMFELLCDGTVDKIAEKIKQKGIPFGIGGIGRLGEGMLPADLILANHYRLGSQAAILSRSFCNLKDNKDLNEIRTIFEDGVREIRAYECQLEKESVEFFENNLKQIGEIVERIVFAKKNND